MYTQLTFPLSRRATSTSFPTCIILTHPLVALFKSPPSLLTFINKRPSASSCLSILVSRESSQALTCREKLVILTSSSLYDALRDNRGATRFDVSYLSLYLIGRERALYDLEEYSLMFGTLSSASDAVTKAKSFRDWVRDFSKIMFKKYFARKITFWHIKKY